MTKNGMYLEKERLLSFVDMIVQQILIRTLIRKEEVYKDDLKDMIKDFSISEEDQNILEIWFKEILAIWKNTAIHSIVSSSKTKLMQSGIPQNKVDEIEKTFISPVIVTPDCLDFGEISVRKPETRILKVTGGPGVIKANGDQIMVNPDTFRMGTIDVQIRVTADHFGVISEKIQLITSSGLIKEVEIIAQVKNIPFSFRNKELQTVDELVMMCESHPEEGIQLLKSGAIEQWLKDLGEKDLATQIVSIRHSYSSHEQKLKEFLDLTGVKHNYLPPIVPEDEAKKLLNTKTYSDINSVAKRVKHVSQKRVIEWDELFRSEKPKYSDQERKEIIRIWLKETGMELVPELLRCACGAIYENSEIYCQQCGKQLLPDIACPHCKDKTPVNSIRCRKCGIEIGGLI